MIRTKLDNASEVEKLFPLLRLTRKMFIIFILAAFVRCIFFYLLVLLFRWTLTCKMQNWGRFVPALSPPCLVVTLSLI